MAFSSIY